MLDLKNISNFSAGLRQLLLGPVLRVPPSSVIYVRLISWKWCSWLIYLRSLSLLIALEYGWPILIGCISHHARAIATLSYLILNHSIVVDGLQVTLLLCWSKGTMALALTVI